MDESVKTPQFLSVFESNSYCSVRFIVFEAARAGLERGRLGLHKAWTLWGPGSQSNLNGPGTGLDIGFHVILR